MRKQEVGSHLFTRALNGDGVRMLRIEIHGPISRDLYRPLDNAVGQRRVKILQPPRRESQVPFFPIASAALEPVPLPVSATAPASESVPAPVPQPVAEEELKENDSIYADVAEPTAPSDQLLPSADLKMQNDTALYAV